MFIETRQLFHWRRTFHKGREIARCKRLIAGIMMFTAAAAIEAAPTGGNVTYGHADISQNTVDQLTHTQIDQCTQRVDIDWTGFNTNTGERVDFLQPNELAVAINRIGGARTQFDGILSANGRIFLINQNGITFGSGSQVNVGSLLATTSDLKEDEMADFSAQGWDQENRSYEFENSGYASVINEGDITVSDGGFAVLAAPRVENRGFIKADLGQIELVSTRAFKLNVDFRGDGLITFQANQDSFENDEIVVDGPLGVENTAAGTLQAHSGHIYLTSAKFANDVMQGVINLSGVVDADQFVKDDNGDVVMVASGYDGYDGYNRDYRGGNIVVKSETDINIGGGTDVHAVGGEQVAALFEAKGDINMGADGDPAKITLKADSGLNGYFDNDAKAEASLVMTAKHGSLNIVDGNIEVTANAVTEQSGTVDSMDDLEATGFGYSRDNNARAVATALLQGENVTINADITVTADAQATAKDVYKLDPGNVETATCFQCESQGTDGAEALAALDVIATGNPYGAPGNLDMNGDINVDANAYVEESRTAKATANTVLVATGDLDVEGDINVNAEATSEPGTYVQPPVEAASYGCEGPYCYETRSGAADANAALVMLGGAPSSLAWYLHRISFDLPRSPGTLSDILTLANAGDLLGSFDGFDGYDGGFDNFGDGGVTYKGDINVTSLAQFDAGSRAQYTTTTVPEQPRREGTAQATSAAVIASGGDEYINTDPIRVESLALANYDDYVFDVPDYSASVFDDGYVDSHVDTEARSFLVFAAGLGDRYVYPSADDGGNGEMGHSDLTILGDVSATAYELETLNGEPHPYPNNPPTIALTALLATGDIKVRGADPLAEAGPLSDDDHTALAQGRSTLWEACDMYGCDEGDGLYHFDGGSHIAQLIIEAGGDIDIQPKTKTQPTGLFLDPIGPGWPGDLPLRFDASGQMLVATGADATRPPRVVALASDVEAAILAGGDPSTLLPPTASGGCVAAGRDAFTVSDTDYFDRLISTSCEAKQ